MYHEQNKISFNYQIIRTQYKLFQPRHRNIKFKYKFPIDNYNKKIYYTTNSP